MARSPVAAGMLNIRSAAILQDVIFASNPCAPGASKRKPLHQFYGTSFDIQGGGVGQRPKKRYDQQRDWAALVAAAVITATILGITHSFAIRLQFLQIYGIGQVEGIIVGAVTYGLIIMLGPFSCLLMKYIGQRLTCIFGMLLFFVGLLYDAFQFNTESFYVSHFMFLGIGGSFAYTSATSSVVDGFRKSLPIAILILSISSPIGTAIFYTFSEFLLTMFPAETSYKWMQLILAVIVLCMIAATHLFPTMIPRHVIVDPFNKYPNKNQKVAIQECIEASTNPTSSDPCEIPQQPMNDEQNSCLCVIVIDVSVWADMSFLLWALISLCAVLSFYIPYLFLVKYSMDVIPPQEQGESIHLIWWFCLASVVGRGASIMGNDHTFGFNRSIFQGCLLGCGILYLFISHAITFGWITVWAIAVGAIEGFITTVIPRVTLQTIPRKWMSSSWSYVVIMHGFGIFVGPTIVICSWAGTGGYYGVGFMIIGIAQIIAALLAFILPNEEGEDNTNDQVSQSQSLLPSSKPESYYFGPNSYSKRLAEYYSNYGNGRSMSSDYNEKYDWVKYVSTNVGDSGLYSYNGISSNISTINPYGTPNPCCVDDNLPAYSTDCPICSKIGCIPGCCVCLPGTSSLSTQNQFYNKNYPLIKPISRINITNIEPDPCLSIPPSSSENKNKIPVAIIKPSASQQRINREPDSTGSSDGMVRRVNLEIRHKTTTNVSGSNKPPIQILPGSSKSTK